MSIFGDTTSGLFAEGFDGNRRDRGEGGGNIMVGATNPPYAGGFSYHLAQFKHFVLYPGN